MNFKTYLGTAAAMTLGLGAVPKRLRVINLATGLFVTDWIGGMNANAAVAGGIIFNNASTMVITAQTAAQGVIRYFGGDLVTTASNNVVVDSSINSTLNVNYASAGQTFTMDVPGNCTGHFSAALTSGYGAGSVIQLAWTDAQGIMRSWMGRITSLTSNGLTANYVTLSLDCPNVGNNARITFVGPQYDLVAAPAGMIMPPGVKLLNTTYMTPAVQMGIEWE